VIFIIALTVYLSTVAPTTSFWDCGEFIAASYTVGVPHPPGAPLYLLIGRLFSMLPLVENIGHRVNLISVILSAITVMLLYLCIVRMARLWRSKEESTVDMITVYGGAAVGALAFAFSHSFWFNAVEAEVYAVSMFFTALVFYLALRWIDSARTPAGNRILLFIFYIIGLSCGVHLLNILALMSVTYIVAFRKTTITVPTFLLTGFIGAAIIFAIYPGIVQGLPTIIEKTNIWTVVVILVFLVILSIVFVKKDYRWPALFTIAILLVILGYSTYILIMIRSGLDPFLDENNPETWKKLLAYLNREQYGSESLFATMFDRKAPFWSYQINKMYIRYFNWQYAWNLGQGLFYIAPLFIGLIGAVHHFYRDRRGAFVVLVLFIMTGLAVVMYLNQDDPQPRERDYAYVGSYFAFAIWIGVGAIALVEWAGKAFKSLAPGAIAWILTGAGLLLVPVNMFALNYKSHSRAGNYVAWDYSYNLLTTCEKDAILFTNGDNDTFPLWYLQTVENVRTDVRVVNLSLFNTGWFIKQIRDKEPKVPLPAKLTDAYIENVIESRDYTGLIERRWQQIRKVKLGGASPDDPPMTWEVPGTISYPVGPQGQLEHFLRVQDIMILNTLVANNWRKPIYFAVTVSEQNLIGLRNEIDTSKNYLKMEGLAFRLTPTPTDIIDSDLMARNLMQNYKYRNINNPDIYYNANIIKLLGNYRQGLLRLALHYLNEAEKAGMMDKSIPVERTLSLAERIEKFEELNPREKSLTTLDFMKDIMPDEVIPVRHDIINLQIGRLYARLGHRDEMIRRLDQIAVRDDLTVQNSFEYGVYYLSEAGEEWKARELFNRSLSVDPSLNNVQRIAYTWIQFSDDTSYIAGILQNYLKLDNSRPAQLQIAVQALMLGLNEMAFSIYEPMIQANPEDMEAYRGMIDYNQRTGDFRRGLEMAESWLASHPDDRWMMQRRDNLAKLTNDTALK